MLKASMAMKCIDHIPPPIAIAAATSHTRGATPRVAATRPPRSRAVKEAKAATRRDSATRCGLYVPVTTIGTVLILEQRPVDDTPTRPRIDNLRYIIPVSGVIGSTDATSPLAVRYRE